MRIRSEIVVGCTWRQMVKPWLFSALVAAAPSGCEGLEDPGASPHAQNGTESVTSETAALHAEHRPDNSAVDEIGREVSVPRHLVDGDEFSLPITALVARGRELFAANWTADEGGGRPLTKGTGAPLAAPGVPLTFPRNFNRLSAPDANSCAGCHNAPFGIPGGGGDIVANVFVLAHRFDFLDFSPLVSIPTVGDMDEMGRGVTLPTVANSRATVGMFGSGFIEMLARSMTADLQQIRDKLQPGQSAALRSRGIKFGVLRRGPTGLWDVSGTEGLPAVSLATNGGSVPPTLIIRPFHQVGRVVSLREFTNNAMNHHHGIQSTERFGKAVDPDGDGFPDELSRADVTAVVAFQATMQVPGQILPKSDRLRDAVASGERLFAQSGCATCHVARLPLVRGEWIFTEPSPYNPPGNLQVGQAPTLSIDLTSTDLPEPRLPVSGHVVWVPAYTDLKLHDMCNSGNDPSREPLDMQQAPGSPAFFAGNCRFLSKKLWGAANEMPYGHHGQFTTMRQAIVLGHHGEAEASRQAFLALTDLQQRSIIEFLKTLQVLPPTRNASWNDDHDRY